MVEIMAGVTVLTLNISYFCSSCYTELVRCFGIIIGEKMNRNELLTEVVICVY